MIVCVCSSEDLRLVENIDYSTLGCNKMYQCEKCGKYKFYGKDLKDNRVYIEGEEKWIVKGVEKEK